MEIGAMYRWSYMEGGRKQRMIIRFVTFLDCGIYITSFVYTPPFFFFWDRVLEQYEEEYIYLQISKVEPIESTWDIYITFHFHSSS